MAAAHARDTATRELRLALVPAAGARGGRRARVRLALLIYRAIILANGEWGQSVTTGRQRATTGNEGTAAHTTTRTPRAWSHSATFS